MPWSPRLIDPALKSSPPSLPSAVPSTFTHVKPQWHGFFFLLVPAAPYLRSLLNKNLHEEMKLKEKVLEAHLKGRLHTRTNITSLHFSPGFSISTNSSREEKA